MTSLSQPKSILPEAEWRVPTRLSGLIFAAKAAGLRLKRRAVDLAAPVAKLATADPADYPVLLAESRTALWSDTRASEARHQFGKVENLRRAATRFDRIAIPAGGVCSFWKQLGRPSRRRGFVAGRMLKEGCLVASTGGGLCQLSNALFDVALKSGAEIVERHAHSRLVPGSAAQFGRDATVAWNYVDFRFKAPQDLMLRSILTDQQLVLQVYGKVSRRQVERPDRPEIAGFPPAANDCGSCRQTGCHRHEAPNDLGRASGSEGRTAFLLDEAWPEFRAYVRERRSRRDLLAIPLDGRRWDRPRYAWETEGFAAVATAGVTTLWHAFRARRQTAQNRRVAAQLLRSKAVAARLARSLTPDVTELCVAQSLLPFLWQMGVLGGRRVTVLMTRLPMAELQARLDAAASAHPDRVTLADFRAPAPLVAAEDEALAAAERIVTPHLEIAALFPGRAERLDWQMPGSAPRTEKPRRAIVFPGPSIARKGAHALREAALALDLEILVVGNDLEGADFWRGLNVRHAARDSSWLDEAAVVVQPALIEEQPRALLAALAAGVPVIAGKSCGIPPHLGLTVLDSVEPADLIHSLGGVVHRLH